MSKVYFNEQYQFAVELNTENELLLMYDLDNGEINYNTEGILKSVNSEIEEHLNISIVDFGVECCDDDGI